MTDVNEEPFIMYDSDEFRACRRLAKQDTPIAVAISNMIDFYGMTKGEARLYYEEALEERKKIDPTTVDRS